jgi:hypothetical protein
MIDGKTGEKLLRLDSIERKELNAYGIHLVPSQMGEVNGFEFVPDSDNSAPPQNFWIVCRAKSESCLRIVPVSKTNPGVLNVIGGLRRSN